MTVFRIVVGLCLILCHAGAVHAAPVAWRNLEPGLDLAVHAVEMPGPATGEAKPLTARTWLVRIDPERFVFSVYMASEKGQRTLSDAATVENFAAAINAGMYLPDKVTNTGYLRDARHTNNPRVASNYGAFFVAQPTGRRPSARLMDKSRHDWQRTLSQYDLVVQNLRMNTPDGRIVWKRSERAHSVAVLSQDDKGRVYFIHCPQAVQAADFVAAILRLGLGLGTVMYLEGGSEAALLVRAGDVDMVQSGTHFTGLWSRGGNLTLPNVLGIRRKASAGGLAR